MVFIFPTNFYAWWSPSFLEMAKLLLASAKQWINYFALLVSTAFAFPVKLSFSQRTSFLNFTLSILSPVPLRWVSKWLCEAELLAGLTHTWTQCLSLFYWGWCNCALCCLLWRKNNITLFRLKIWENPNLLMKPFKKLLSPLYFCSNAIVQYWKSQLMNHFCTL